jgi:hypothetical protein
MAVRNFVSAPARDFGRAPERIGLALALLLTGGVLPAQQALAQDDHRIVPWERIGAVQLGMPAAELMRNLGEPSQTIIGSLDTGVIIYHWGNDLHVFVKKEGEYVTQICALSPDYATAEGIRPGASETAIKAALGPPLDATIHRGWWKYTYSDLRWRGLTIRVFLTGFETTHVARRVCVNHSS